VTPAEALLHYALVGLPCGLVLGLALGLVARRERGWGGYGSFRRRAARLGHVAAVMLPLIGGFYALALGPHPGDLAQWAARLWIAGGVLLPVVLFLAAWRPRFQLLLPAPATALTLGSAGLALAYLGS
jgi:NhaP-type Na+/H+ or K+/H+ antiporter